MSKKLIIKTPITNESEDYLLNLPNKNSGEYTIAVDEDVVHKGTAVDPASAESRYGALSIYGDLNVLGTNPDLPYTSKITLGSGMGSIESNGSGTLNIIAGNYLTLKSNHIYLSDKGNSPKQAELVLSNITAGTTRTLTVQDKDGTIAIDGDVIHKGSSSIASNEDIYGLKTFKGTSAGIKVAGDNNYTYANLTSTGLHVSRGTSSAATAYSEYSPGTIHNLEIDATTGSVVSLHTIALPKKSGTFAIDSELVHKGSSSSLSDEEIYGTKTFKFGGISFSSASSTEAINITGSGPGAEVRICSADNTFPTYLRLGSTSSIYGELAFSTYGSGSDQATIQYSRGSGSTAKNAYLRIPNVGTSSNPKTIATTDDIPSVLGTGASNKDKYLHTNASTGALEWSSGGGGDVTGPASSTDNTIAVFDGTTGKIIKSASNISIDNATAVLSPTLSSLGSLGSSSKKWGSVHTQILTVYTRINSNSSNKGLVLPDTTSYTADRTLATTDDIPNNSNVENSTGTSALQQKQDGTGGTFDFTNKNPHATALDSSLTGNITFGGVGNYATSFGGKSQASGKRSLAQGTTTVAKGNYSHAEGDNSVALGSDSHAEGYQTVSYGGASHAEGTSTQALGNNSHAEGNSTIARAVNSHAEGYSSETLTSDSSRPNIPAYNDQQGGGSSDPGQGGTSTPQTGDGAHVEGSNTKAVGNYSHAEGTNTWAGGLSSHAEGYGSQALYDYAHAEGYNCLASGYGSHATGLHTVASGNYSFTQGQQTEASYNLSSAFGKGTETGYESQTVVGRYNAVSGDALFVVGNGNGISGNSKERSNALSVHADGTVEVGDMGTTNLSVATKQYVDNHLPLITQNLTESAIRTLAVADWSLLKLTHASTTTTSITNIDSSYEFVAVKFTIPIKNSTGAGADFYVKLIKNTYQKYSGLFFVEETDSNVDHLYEITVYYNDASSKLTLRCATVY